MWRHTTGKSFLYKSFCPVYFAESVRIRTSTSEYVRQRPTYLLPWRRQRSGMEQVSGFWVNNGQKWTGNAISAPPEIKREAPVSASLSINNYYLLSLAIGRSLPDTKMLENIPQHLVRGDFAEDGAEVVEGLAEVFGEEVGSLAGGEGTFDVFEGFGRFHQGLVVP